MKSTALKARPARVRRAAKPAKTSVRPPEFGGGTWLHRRMMEVTGGKGLAFGATARAPSPRRPGVAED
jgi:hypothetical protein